MTERPTLVDWVARNILTHEPALRRWLRGSFPRHDPDDIVQETYCRLALVDDPHRIADPKRYLFQVARNVVLTELRRSRIVHIDAIGSTADMEQALANEADELSPERILAGRGLLSRVDALVDGLPERARAIFRLRKIEGLSQREIAERMGVRETIVENDLARALKAILAALTDDERQELRNGRRRRGHGRA